MNSAKPLARWTIGRVHPCGWEVLFRSIKAFPYSEFDKVICYNNLTEKELKKLSTLGVTLHQQIASQLDHPVGTSGWKLVPPRLQPDGYELWIDNDLIIRQKFPALDKWLTSRTSFISQGIIPGGLYGKYKGLVKSRVPLCAGLFGLPPFFDFNRAILDRCHRILGSRALNLPFDEQGLTASVVTSFPDFICAPLQQVMVCERFSKKYPAMHFVGVNRGRRQAWDAYRRTEIML